MNTYQSKYLGKAMFINAAYIVACWAAFFMTRNAIYGAGLLHFLLGVYAVLGGIAGCVSMLLLAASKKHWDKIRPALKLNTKDMERTSAWKDNVPYWLDAFLDVLTIVPVAALGWYFITFLFILRLFGSHASYELYKLFLKPEMDKQKAATL